MSSYRIERLIGIGGEAVVYEARPLLPGGHGAPVACKLMREEPRASAATRARIWQEADLGLRVTPGHPNLVRVLDCFEDIGEGPCIVMELVDGGSLEALLGAGRLPFPITRRVACEVLQALAYLHGQDVLHRDLSPCNILISTSGSVKIADLGIAKVMEAGRAYTKNYRGKLVYDSPEGIQTLTLDARSDLYTLAAVLYELLAGAPPCGETEAFADIVTGTLRGEFAPLPADAPADLAELVTGLLRPERDDRAPQTATGALALLRRHAQPVASAAELAALVMAMRSQRGAEPGGAHRAPDLAPGEMLEPGDVLVARTDMAPGEVVPPAQAAQPTEAAPSPVFPLPAEPALPPLPQPSRRITATLTGPGQGGSSSSDLGPDAAGPDAPEVPEGMHRGRRRTTRHAMLVRALDVAVTAACILALGCLLADGFQREQDAFEREQVTGERAPVTEHALPAPVPIPVRREPPVPRDAPGKTARPRVVERADEPRRKQTEMQRRSQRAGTAPMRRPEPLGDEPPSWAAP